MARLADLIDKAEAKCRADLTAQVLFASNNPVVFRERVQATTTVFNALRAELTWQAPTM